MVCLLVFAVLAAGPCFMLQHSPPSLRVRAAGGHLDRVALPDCWRVDFKKSKGQSENIDSREPYNAIQIAIHAVELAQLNAGDTAS